MFFKRIGKIESNCFRIISHDLGLKSQKITYKMSTHFLEKKRKKTFFFTRRLHMFSHIFTH